MPVPAEPERAETVPVRIHQHRVASVMLLELDVLPGQVLAGAEISQKTHSLQENSSSCLRFEPVKKWMKSNEANTVTPCTLLEVPLQGLSVSWWRRIEGLGNSPARQLMV